MKAEKRIENRLEVKRRVGKPAKRGKWDETRNILQQNHNISTTRERERTRAPAYSHTNVFLDFMIGSNVKNQANQAIWFQDHS